MAKRTIQTCRFYADVMQYLKILGYYEGSNSPELWNMNPSLTNEYELSGLTNFDFNIKNPSKELDQLLTNVPQSSSSGIYGAVLGHTLKNQFIHFRTVNDPFSLTENIINYSTEPEYNGYSIWDIQDCGAEENIDKIRLAINVTEDTDAKIGSISYGRWFEPSHSPDLKVRLISEYDGVTNQTTVGGNSITNVNHLGQPHWGDLPAWTLEKKEGHDYKLGADTNRRVWELSFSYMTDDDVFSKSNNPNKFFTVTDDSYVFDSSMASFFRLTLNGSLPFIFCPSSAGSNTEANNEEQIQQGDKDLEFAICKLTKNLKLQEQAPNLYRTTIQFREVW